MLTNLIRFTMAFLTHCHTPASLAEVSMTRTYFGCGDLTTSNLTLGITTGSCVTEFSWAKETKSWWSAMTWRVDQSEESINSINQSDDRSNSIDQSEDSIYLAS